MKTLIIIELIICWLLIVAVLLPLVRNDYWIFRILEYPRFQKFIICCFMLAIMIFSIEYANTFHIVSVSLLGLCVLFLAYKISPYTPFFPIEMKTIKEGKANNQLKIFTANIYQPNTNYHKILEQIRQCDPDIIMLMETDGKWAKEMSVLKNDFPFCLEEPLDNMYGLLFYSRLEIIEGSIQHMIEPEIPSVEATIKFSSGQKVKIWGLHPKPPVPGEENNSTAKDMEIMQIAFKARKETLPAIVMGDLNDVAWSRVTKLFRKTSGLLDPRRGRGFYSTFNAKYWFVRFPLDYIFGSEHFGLVKLKRLAYNGSDHFPMFTQFEFNPELKKIQEKPKADEEELKEGREEANGN